MGNADFKTLAHGIVCKCGFKITEKKMAEIVSSKVTAEIVEGLVCEGEIVNANYSA